MKQELNISIKSTSGICSITINGVTRTYTRTASGCRGDQKGDFEDDLENGLISRHYEKVIDRLSFIAMDAIHACYNAEFDE